MRYDFLFGIFSLGLTLSWNILEGRVPLHASMDGILSALAITFHLLFALVAMVVHERYEFCTLVDNVVAALSLSMDAVWTANQKWTALDESDLVIFSFLMLYMIIQLYKTTLVSNNDKTWRQMSKIAEEVGGGNGGPQQLQKLQFIWVTRSAQLVSELAPTLDEIWRSLCDTFVDEDSAKQLCDISVYVTDPNKDVCNALAREMQHLHPKLFASQAFHFERPDFRKIIQTHTLRLIQDRKKKYTNTLIAFCGSPSLSIRLKMIKAEIEMLTFVGNEMNHTTCFLSESYGAAKTPQKRARLSTTYNATAHVSSRLTNDAATKSSNASYISFMNDRTEQLIMNSGRQQRGLRPPQEVSFLNHGFEDDDDLTRDDLSCDNLSRDDLFRDEPSRDGDGSNDIEDTRDAVAKLQTKSSRKQNKGSLNLNYDIINEGVGCGDIEDARQGATNLPIDSIPPPRPVVGSPLTVPDDIGEYGEDFFLQTENIFPDKNDDSSPGAEDDPIPQPYVQELEQGDNECHSR